MHELFEVIWRTLVVFALLAILTRIVGRRLLSQMTFYEFVTGVTIGTIAGAYVVNAIRGLYVLVSPVVLTICAVALSYFLLKSLKARKLFEGEPVIIMQNGKILEDNMTRARYSLDSLEMQLRIKGVFNINEVEFAVLEPHGQLSVLKKTPYNPVTPKDLNISTGYKGLPTEIIKDGIVLEQNLEQNNLDFRWLYNELYKQSIKDVSQVILASLNTDGSLYIDLRESPPDYKQEVED
ncbi:MAG: YetF domain-containing protein [Halanaerobiaceae bacterium]